MFGFSLKKSLKVLFILNNNHHEHLMIFKIKIKIRGFKSELAIVQGN